MIPALIMSTYSPEVAEMHELFSDHYAAGKKYGSIWDRMVFAGAPQI
jgi:hypothetical protein